MSMKESKSLEQRRIGMKKAWSALETVPAYKENNFYMQMFEHMQTVGDKAGTLYRESKQQTDVVDGSLQNYIGLLVGEGKHRNENKAKDLRKHMNIPERLFETIIVQAHIKDKMWMDVKAKIDMKKPPVPFASIGELCYSANNKEKAIEAIKKVSDQEVKIMMLMNYKCWQPCVEEIFATKTPERWIEQLLSPQTGAPSFVHDQVKNMQR